MSKKFKVPVVLNIKANTREDADILAHRFMCHAGESTLNHEPALHNKVKWWDLAVLSGKITARCGK